MQIRSMRKNARRALSFLSRKKWARVNGSRGAPTGAGRSWYEQNGKAVAPKSLGRVRHGKHFKRKG